MIETFLLLIFFLFFQGFFSGMETGLFSLLRPRVEHAAKRGDAPAERLLYFLHRPGIMITTALIGVDTGVVLSTLMTRRILFHLEISNGFFLALASIALSILILCFEIIPKNYFRESAFRRCRSGIWLFYLFYRIFFIPIRLFAALSSLLNFLAGHVRKESGEGFGGTGDRRKEEFRLYLRESRISGDVDEGTVSLLDHAMDIPGMLISRIMIDRGKAREIPSSMTIREAFVYCQKEDLTKVPVYDEKSAGHRWCGVFSIYKAIYEVEESLWGSLTVSECMEMLSFIESDLKLGEVLERFRKRKITLFCVLDPDKKQIGILRPEDLAALLFQK